MPFFVSQQTPFCFLTMWSYFSHFWVGFLIVKSWFESYYIATACKAIFFFKPGVMLSYGISECFSLSTDNYRYWWLTSKLQYITTVIPSILFHFAIEPVKSKLAQISKFAFSGKLDQNCLYSNHLQNVSWPHDVLTSVPGACFKYWAYREANARTARSFGGWGLAYTCPFHKASDLKITLPAFHHWNSNLVL